MTAPADFAARLKALRLQAGLSVARLALASGLNREALHRLEAGGRAPTWDTVLKLCEALGTTPDAFLPPPL